MNSKQFKVLRNLTLLTGVAAVLVGCAPHLNRQQCMTINWYQMGYSDGSQGRYQRNLQQDILDCAKFKLKVNQSAYLKGWQAGVRRFCTPGTGYRLGTEGRTYNKVCPANLAGRFNRAWHRGLRRYCVAGTGYSLGREGKPMPAFCSPNTNVGFRNAYESGYRIYQATSSLRIEIATVDDQISQTKSAIRGKRRDIRKWQNILAKAPQHDRPTKRLARRNIREDNRAITDMEFRLNRLTRHRDALEQDLNREQTS